MLLIQAKARVNAHLSRFAYTISDGDKSPRDTYRNNRRTVLRPPSQCLKGVFGVRTIDPLRRTTAEIGERIVPHRQYMDRKFVWEHPEGLEIGDKNFERKFWEMEK